MAASTLGPPQLLIGSVFQCGCAIFPFHLAMYSTSSLYLLVSKTWHFIYCHIIITMRRHTPWGVWRWENNFVKSVLFFHHADSGLSGKLHCHWHLVNTVASILYFSVPNSGVMIISCAFHAHICTYHVLKIVMFNIFLGDEFHLHIFFAKCLLICLATFKTEVWEL